MRIRKKVSPTVDIKATRQSIMDLIVKKRAQLSEGGLPPRKGREKVLAHQALAKKSHQIQKESKLEVPSLVGAAKKGRLVLKSLED